MKYIAQPVQVDAFVINNVSEPGVTGDRVLGCSEERTFIATPAMMSRMEPKPGDYVVIQSDNYTYLNPKEVFERKYAKFEDLLDGRIALSDGTVLATEPYRDLEMLRLRGLVDAEGKPL